MNSEQLHAYKSDIDEAIELALKQAVNFDLRIELDCYVMNATQMRFCGIQQMIQSKCDGDLEEIIEQVARLVLAFDESIDNLINIEVA